MRLINHSLNQKFNNSLLENANLYADSTIETGFNFITKHSLLKHDRKRFPSPVGFIVQSPEPNYGILV